MKSETNAKVSSELKRTINSLKQDVFNQMFIKEIYKITGKPFAIVESVYLPIFNNTSIEKIKELVEAAEEIKQQIDTSVFDELISYTDILSKGEL